jgi:ketosteroid isomerase-like protein
MKRLLIGSLLFTSVLILYSCKPKPDMKALADGLLQADRDFARESVEKGISNCFYKYLDDDCVLLRPNKYPIKGKAKILDMYSTADTNSTLTWVPLYAYVAESGELGYTYGTYKMKFFSPEGDPLTNEGTYVNIWKKDKDGNWKYVLDSGNRGLGNK